MAEFTAVAAQTVTANNNVLFSETPIIGGRCITHREGSGLVTLRGLTNGQCRARYRVFFSGNISIPTGGTAGEISMAIAINGERIPSATMTVTPRAVENPFNVARSVFVDVPAGCCLQVSAKNISTTAITVANANLIVERVA